MKVTIDDLTDRLVKVFSDEKELADYNGDNELSGICGWCGVMSPLSRPAYIKKFGQRAVETAEYTAKKLIEQRQYMHEHTRYYAHKLEADEWQSNGCPVPVEAGQFVWASCSGMKGDGSYLEELVFLSKDKRHRPLLLKIEKVVKVDHFPSYRDLCEIIEKEGLSGGSESEDTPDNIGWYQMTEEQKKTIFQIGAAIVLPDDRCFIIDAEGYDYPRYYYSLPNWQEKFATEFAEELKAQEESK
jgi:hypothetical protein